MKTRDNIYVKLSCGHLRFMKYATTKEAVGDPLYCKKCDDFANLLGVARPLHGGPGGPFSVNSF